MNNGKKPVFLTNGTGIYKIEKLIRAVILKNLETAETVTAEIIGSTVPGFAIIDMPKIVKTKDDSRAGSPEGVPKEQKMVHGQDARATKVRKRKSSQYFGVSFNKKSPTKKWKTAIWIGGKNISAGGFIDEVEAARAVDAMLEKRGLPRRNFPQASA